MKKKIARLSAVAVSVWIVSTSAAFCAFEDKSLGARLDALGGVSAAIASGADSIAGNPATFSDFSCAQVAAGYSRLFTGLSDGSELSRASLSLGIPISMFSFAAGFDNLGLAGVYSEETISAGLSWEYKKVFSVGAAYRRRGIKITRDDYLASDPLFAAEYAKYFPELAYGLCASLGGFSLGYTGASLDGRYRIYKDPEPDVFGVAYVEPGFVFAADYICGERKKIWAIGVEKYFFKNVFAGRAGFDFGGNDYKKVTAGFGFSFGNIRGDYALDYPLGGIAGTSGTHRFTLSTMFSPSRSPSETSVPKSGVSADAALPPAVSAPAFVSPPPAPAPSMPAPLVSPPAALLSAVAGSTSPARAMPQISVPGALAAPRFDSSAGAASGIPTPIAAKRAVAVSTAAANSAEISLSTGIGAPAVPQISVSTPTTPILKIEVSAPLAPAVSNRENVPAPTPVEPAAPVRVALPAARTHQVAPGDTLMSLSEKYYKNKNEWMKIYKVNEDKIEKGIVRPGDVLIIP